MAKPLIVDIEITLTKSTPGTHVLGNEDAGIKGVYIPKMYFTNAKVNPDGKKFRLTLTEVA